MSLKDMIREIVTAEIKGELDGLLSEALHAPAERIVKAPRAEQPEAERSAQRFYQPRTAYQLTAKGQRVLSGKGSKAERETLSAMFPTHLDTLKAIGKGKRALSNREIEHATGHGKKTIESAVWQLHAAGLVGRTRYVGDGRK